MIQHIMENYAGFRGSGRNRTIELGGQLKSIFKFHKIRHSPKIIYFRKKAKQKETKQHEEASIIDLCFRGE